MLNLSRVTTTLSWTAVCAIFLVGCGGPDSDLGVSSDAVIGGNDATLGEW